MSGDQWTGLIGIAAMIVLVGSGLIARRLPARSIALMGLAWLVIFAVALLIARSIM
jgi:putative Ca2+/H+ antiporter (TMEM165/GDT1 family)